MNLRIRLTTGADANALARLAALDSSSFDAPAALVAEVDGELWAALPLAGGPAIADPFRATADVVTLLELRREQLARPAPSPRRAVRRLLRSPARA